MLKCGRRRAPTALRACDPHGCASWHAAPRNMGKHRMRVPLGWRAVLASTDLRPTLPSTAKALATQTVLVCAAAAATLKRLGARAGRAQCVVPIPHRWPTADTDTPRMRGNNRAGAHVRSGATPVRTHPRAPACGASLCARPHDQLCRCAAPDTIDGAAPLARNASGPARSHRLARP